ncbi:MAG: LacI family DNA-binding transcriptional regulator [Rhodocyclaceae bacterium]
MQTKRPATIRDVAQAAGVSTATVSKFINRLQRFSPEVEARIRTAVDTLGYRQNPAARSMVTGQTRTVGLAIQDVRNPHFANIVKGANRVALAHDYSLLVIDIEENPSGERALLEALSRRVDGLIVSSRIPEESIDWLAEIGKPVVFFGRLLRLGIPCVRSDGYQAAYMLGRHLVELGMQRIAYVGFVRARWNSERLHGLTDALAEANLTPIVHEIEAPTLEAGERAASSVLLGGPRPEAVVGYNDLVTLGLMHEAQALGLRIPEDVAMAGFDDIPVARYMQPPLTSVDMRSEQQGEAAMNRLLTAIAREEGDSDVLLEPRLIPRASTRRPLD